MPQVRTKKGHARRPLGILPFEFLSRPRARMGNPNTGIPEVIVQPLYDIYFVAVAAAFPLVTLFTVPKGQQYTLGGVAAFTKNFAHTNLLQAGMLQSSYTYVVRALSMYVQAQQGTAHPLVHPEDMANLLSTFGRFEINSKSYFDGILGWLPAGGGMSGFGFGTLTAPNSASVTTNGWPDAGNIYALPGGQFINPQEQFDFIIDPTQNALLAGGNGAPTTLALVGNPAGVPAAGLGAWVRFDGTLIRVAQ